MEELTIIRYFEVLGHKAARNLAIREVYDYERKEFLRLYSRYHNEVTEGNWTALTDWCAERGVYVYAEVWHNGTTWLAIDLAAKWLEA